MYLHSANLQNGLNRFTDRAAGINAWLDTPVYSRSELIQLADEAWAVGNRDACAALIEQIYASFPTALLISPSS